jgi:uncharacterized protein involved in outer membrane biogenesis
MRRLIRWVIRLVLGLILLVLAGAVVAILLLDTISKELLVSRLRSNTGMEVKINSVHVGLLSPTLSIEGFKLYNTANFGGSVCLDMPELHLEYDPSALRARQLHVTLLRLDLAELTQIVDKQGRNNFSVPGKKTADSTARKNQALKLTFTGIDVMNVTLGKYRQTNLGSGRGEEIDFGIKNRILRNVKTEADLAPLGLPMSFRSHAPGAGDSGLDLIQVLDRIIGDP